MDQNHILDLDLSINLNKAMNFRTYIYGEVTRRQNLQLKRTSTSTTSLLPLQGSKKYTKISLRRHKGLGFHIHRVEAGDKEHDSFFIQGSKPKNQDFMHMQSCDQDMGRTTTYQRGSCCITHNSHHTLSKNPFFSIIIQINQITTHT